MAISSIINEQSIGYSDISALAFKADRASSENPGAALTEEYHLLIVRGCGKHVFKVSRTYKYALGE